MSAMIGFAVLIAAGIIAHRIALRHVDQDFCQTRPGKPGSPVEPPVAIPHGWTFDTYVADGLRSLRVMLIQAARR